MNDNMKELKEYANEVPSAEFDVRGLLGYLTGLAQVQTESWWNDAEKWAENEAVKEAKQVVGDTASEAVDAALDAGVDVISTGINAIGNSLASDAEEGIEE